MCIKIQMKICIFTFSSWMRRYWFYVKMTFEIFIKSLRFETPESEKTVITKVSVCLFKFEKSQYQNSIFQLNYTR